VDNTLRPAAEMAGAPLRDTLLVNMDGIVELLRHTSFVAKASGELAMPALVLIHALEALVSIWLRSSAADGGLNRRPCGLMGAWVSGLPYIQLCQAVSERVLQLRAKHDPRSVQELNQWVKQHTPLDQLVAEDSPVLRVAQRLDLDCSTATAAQRFSRNGTANGGWELAAAPDCRAPPPPPHTHLTCFLPPPPDLHACACRLSAAAGAPSRARISRRPTSPCRRDHQEAA
jgi:hypothetical protein